MPQEKVKSLPSLNAWQVENLRLSAFPTPSFQATESTWWADVVGEKPETNISRPRKGNWQQKGVLEEERELRLTVQPNRIDWLLSISSEYLTQPPEDFPFIGPFSQLLDVFLPLMRRWFELETCPDVRRLAFGAVLWQPMKDRVTGYQQLSKYLPQVQLDSERSFDFVYQINRPRTSKSKHFDFRINRLSKWSVATWRHFGVSMGPGGVTGEFSGQESYACRLQLDVNTSQDFQGEINREQLPEVFEELVDLGQEIVRKGDIP